MTTKSTGQLGPGMRGAYGASWDRVLSAAEMDALIPIQANLSYFQQIEDIDLGNSFVAEGRSLAGRPTQSHIFMALNIYGATTGADDFIQSNAKPVFNNKASGQPTCYITRRNLDNTVAWSHRLGGAGISCQVTDMQMDPQGDLWVTGVASGVFTFPDGWSNPGSFSGNYVWWAKVSASGTWLWTITTGVSSGTAISNNPDNTNIGVDPYVCVSEGNDGGGIIGIGGGRGVNDFNIYGTNLTAYPTGDGTVTAPRWIMYGVNSSGVPQWRKNGASATVPATASTSIRAGLLESNGKVWCIGLIQVNSGSDFIWQNVTVSSGFINPRMPVLFQLDAATHTPDNEMPLQILASAGSFAGGVGKMVLSGDDIYWIAEPQGSSGGGITYSYPLDPSGTGSVTCTLVTANSMTAVLCRINRLTGRYKEVTHLNVSMNRTYPLPVLLERDNCFAYVAGLFSSSTSMRCDKWDVGADVVSSLTATSTIFGPINISMCPRLNAAGKVELVGVVNPHNQGGGTTTYPNSGGTCVTTSTLNRLSFFKAR